MTFKQFLELEEVILEDWRLWAMGLSPGEIQTIIKEWYENYLKFKKETNGSDYEFFRSVETRDNTWRANQ